MVCAMLSRGKFSQFLINGLYVEAANTDMLLKNNLITVLQDIHGSKLANQGTTGMWLDFPDVYPVGTYQVLNPKT